MNYSVHNNQIRYKIMFHFVLDKCINKYKPFKNILYDEVRTRGFFFLFFFIIEMRLLSRHLKLYFFYKKLDVRLKQLNDS